MDDNQDSKVHRANMSAPDGPQVGPMNLGLRVGFLWFVSDAILAPGTVHIIMCVPGTDDGV